MKSFFSNQLPLPRDEIIPGDEKSLFYLELLRPEFGEFPEKISLPTWPIFVKKSITGLFFQCENFQKKTDFSKINKNEEQNTEKEETLSWITKSDSQKLNSNLLILDPNLSIPRLSFNDSLTASIGEFGLSFNYTQSLENTQTQKNEENQKENFIKKLKNEEVIEPNHSVKLKINYLENKFRNLTNESLKKIPPESKKEVFKKVMNKKKKYIKLDYLPKDHLKKFGINNIEKNTNFFSNFYFKEPLKLNVFKNLKNINKKKDYLEKFYNLTPIGRQASALNLWVIKKQIQNKNKNSSLSSKSKNQSINYSNFNEKSDFLTIPKIKTNKFFATKSSLSFAKRNSHTKKDFEKIEIFEESEKNIKKDFNFRKFDKKEKKEISLIQSLEESFCRDSMHVLEFSSKKHIENLKLDQKKIKSAYMILEQIKKPRIKTKKVLKKRKIKSISKLNEMKKFYKKIIITKLDKNLNFRKNSELPYQVLKEYRKYKHDFESFSEFIKKYFKK